MAASIRVQGGYDTIPLADLVAEVVGNLTGRLQVREARAIEESWADVVELITAEQPVTGVEQRNHETRKVQLAAAERQVIPLTRMWLGLTSAADEMRNGDLEQWFEDALTKRNTLYKGNFPTDTRKTLEQFANALQRETRIEGRRITPSWFANHHIARSLAGELHAAHQSLLELISRRTSTQSQQLRSAGKPELAAINALRTIELLNRVSNRSHLLTEAHTRLAEMRNRNTGDELWPDAETASTPVTELEAQTFRTLGPVLADLRSEKFNDEYPDLYGQAYHFLFDRAHAAILAQDTELATYLFNVIFDEIGPARTRQLNDTNHMPTEGRVAYAVEPLVSAMELSGYALMMQELDGKGIWTEAKGSWDRLVSAGIVNAEFMLTSVQIADDVFNGTSGKFARSERADTFAQTLTDRGIRKIRDVPFRPSARRPHQSPIVSAMAPDEYNIGDGYHQLFVAEYVVPLLPEGHEVPEPINSLVHALVRYRSEEVPGDQGAK